MSEIISLQLTDEQIARLDRAAQKAGQTRAEMAATLLEEAFRLSEFPFVEFRDWGAGREAFLAGTRLRIWWVAQLVRDLGGDTAYVAKNWNLREVEVEAAVKYADAFSDEIEAVIADNRRRADELERKLSKSKGKTVDLTADAPAS